MLLLPVSALAFGTVHAGPRVVLAVVAGLVGAAALARTGGRRGASADARAATGLGLLAGAVAALAFVPLPAALREGLMADLAPAIDQALAVVGRAGDARPLALDPGRGLVEWSVYVAMVLVVGGTAAVTRNRRRARRLAGALVATGVGIAAIALVHDLTGAERIWWMSGVPHELGRPFFAPFVNPNHAGVLMAVAAPSAVALLLDRKDSAKAVGAVGLLVLLAGALFSGSRGAIVLLVLGVVVALALSGPRAVRIGVVGLGAAALVGVGLAGPATVAAWLTTALDPAQSAAVAAGYEDVWSGRLEVYQDLRVMLMSAPLLGVGPAGFDDAWQVLRTGDGFTFTDHAHQELAQAVIEHGLPATLLALGALVPLGRAAMRPDPDGGRGLARLQAGFAGGVVVVMAAAMYELPLRAGAITVAAALCAGGVLGLAQGRVAGPGGLRLRALLGAGGALMVLAGTGLWGGAALSGSGVFASADTARDEGRQLLVDADLLRDAWSLGGDPAVLAAADEAFARSIWRQPVNREALQLLARVRHRQGDRDGAVAALDAATAVYPSLPWAWRDLARLHRADGDDLAAWLAWNRALSFDLPPDFPVEAWVKEALTGPGGAMVAALAALPPRADRWETAAHIVEGAGYREEADWFYGEAAALDPELTAQHAFALLRRGEAAAALAVLPEDPKRCGEQRARGSALLQLARCEEAVTWAERSLATCGSDDRDVRLLLARARLCTGDERSLDSLEALVRERPEDPGPRRTLAREYAERGRRDAALGHLRVLDEAGQLDPRDAALLDSLTR